MDGHAVDGQGERGKLGGRDGLASPTSYPSQCASLHSQSLSLSVSLFTLTPSLSSHLHVTLSSPFRDQTTRGVKCCYDGEGMSRWGEQAVP